MKQLDQRVSKLEEVMGNRPPRLDGMSLHELEELLKANPASGDLILTAMSDEQLEEMYNQVRVRFPHLVK
jgi:hypothetical protein